jgi:hypothetical protein
VRKSANRECWAAKVLLVFALLAGSIFIPNSPLFSGVFLNVARISSPFFIIVQYLVLVKMSQAINDRWTARSEAAQRSPDDSAARAIHRRSSRRKVISCFILYAAVVALYIYLFGNYTGCPTNDVFIVSSAILSVLITAALIASPRGSLLAGGVVSFWSVFLVFFAVSSNPDESCNPRLGASGMGTVILGLLFTFVSISWTGWSHHAEGHLLQLEDSVARAKSQPNSSTGRRSDPSLEAKGEGTSSSTDGNDLEAQAAQNGGSLAEGSDSLDDPRMNTWHINLILATVVCWKALVLTHWGSIAADGQVANPKAGTVAMWIIMPTSWVCSIAYLWRLVALQLIDPQL